MKKFLIYIISLSLSFSSTTVLAAQKNHWPGSKKEKFSDLILPLEAFKALSPEDRALYLMGLVALAQVLESSHNQIGTKEIPKGFLQSQNSSRWEMWMNFWLHKANAVVLGAAASAVGGAVVKGFMALKPTGAMWQTVSGWGSRIVNLFPGKQAPLVPTGQAATIAGTQGASAVKNTAKDKVNQAIADSIKQQVEKDAAKKAASAAAKGKNAKAAASGTDGAASTAANSVKSLADQKAAYQTALKEFETAEKQLANSIKDKMSDPVKREALAKAAREAGEKLSAESLAYHNLFKQTASPKELAKFMKNIEKETSKANLSGITRFAKTKMAGVVVGATAATPYVLDGAGAAWNAAGDGVNQLTTAAGEMASGLAKAGREVAVDGLTGTGQFLVDTAKDLKAGGQSTADPNDQQVALAAGTGGSTTTATGTGKYKQAEESQCIYGGRFSVWKLQEVDEVGTKELRCTRPANSWSKSCKKKTHFICPGYGAVAKGEPIEKRDKMCVPLDSLEDLSIRCSQAFATILKDVETEIGAQAYVEFTGQLKEAFKKVEEEESMNGNPTLAAYCGDGGNEKQGNECQALIAIRSGVATSPVVDKAIKDQADNPPAKDGNTPPVAPPAPAATDTKTTT